ncbi:MAG: ATP-binding protein [Bacteroidota bacterium]
MTKEKKVFDGISDRANQLLIGDENHHVDFKRSPKGVTSEDMVAFANSEHGGTLLLGVDEEKDEIGRQTGQIVGCEVSDDMKLLLTSRAFSCFPPVDISIYIENNATLPFYRVEIPSGKNKPYCTSGGTYKIRDDGRNKVLRPNELLTLFIHHESADFFKRFKEVSEYTHDPRHSEDMEKVKQEIAMLQKKVDEILGRLS